jgi:hypothetical protein
LPEPSSNCKLNIDWVDNHMEEMYAHVDTGDDDFSTTSGMLRNRERLVNAILSRPNSMADKQKEDMKERTTIKYCGGRVLWSLIPSSFIGTMCGLLYFLPNVSSIIYSYA